jgi:hypothetical protein
MSLDMIMGTRAATVEDEGAIAAAPAERLWLRNLMVAAAAALGVTMSSALGVLLFLR